MVATRGLIAAVVVLALAGSAGSARAASLAPGRLSLTLCDGSCLALDRPWIDEALCATVPGGAASAPTDEPTPTCEPIRTTLILPPAGESLAVPAALAVDTQISAFDGRGRAVARLTVESVCLEGLASLQTSCGAWTFRGRVATSAPAATELLLLATEGTGGSFVGDLALDLDLTFTHGPTGRRVTLRDGFVFSGAGSWVAVSGSDLALRPPVCSPLAPAPTTELGLGSRRAGAEVVTEPFSLVGDGRLCLEPLPHAPSFKPPRSRDGLAF